MGEPDPSRILSGKPLSVEPCCIVTLGWARGRYGRKARKPVGTVAHLDQYGSQPWRDQAPA